MKVGDIVKLEPVKYGSSLSESWGLGVVVDLQDIEEDWRIVKVQWMSGDIPLENRVDTHLALDLSWVTPYVPG